MKISYREFRECRKINELWFKPSIKKIEIGIVAAITAKMTTSLSRAKYIIIGHAVLFRFNLFWYAYDQEVLFP